jgi:hypothetical protein
MAFTGHQQGNLSLDFTRNRTNPAGQFVGNNLAGRNSAAVKVLEPLMLTGFESACFAEYFLDSLILELEERIWRTRFENAWVNTSANTGVRPYIT